MKCSLIIVWPIQNNNYMSEAGRYLKLSNYFNIITSVKHKTCITGFKKTYNVSVSQLLTSNVMSSSS